MRVLVTGSAGFIASYLIPELLQTGATVIGLDLVRRPAVYDGAGTSLVWERGDLRSTEHLYRAFMRHRPSHVLHLGSLLAGPCEDDPLTGFRTNFLSTAALLDASVETNVERFVMASSISVFGRDVPEPVADDAIKNPTTVYGQTKLASEHLMEWYRTRHGLSVGAPRFPWVFGPGRERGITALYSSKLLDAVARSIPLEIRNPDERGNWLYVRDAIRALRLFLTVSDHSRVAYNVMGSVHTVREVLEIARELRPDASIRYVDAGVSASPYPSTYDDSGARSDLGWAPSYRIDRAVREHIETVENE